MTGVVMAMMGLSGMEGGSLSSAASGKESSQMIIVALGDSLTEGYGVKTNEAYPARLERKLHEAGYEWRVINAGISGETSSETLLRLNRVVSLKPSIVVLEIGVNDGFRGVDPSIIERNIDEIVTSLKKNGIAVVLAGMRMFDSPATPYGLAFADIYLNVATRHDLAMIPHFLEGVTGNPQLNRLDGIHPNAKGYRIVADTVYPHILQAAEELTGRK